MSEPELLFVYGTLRPGEPGAVARMLAERARVRGAARVRGRLYRVADYPGLLLNSAGAGWVPGDVYELRGAKALLKALDAYEGCGPDDPPPHEFERVRAEAVLESGEGVRVWVYVYRGRIGRARRIGAWARATGPAVAAPGNLRYRSAGRLSLGARPRDRDT